MYLPYVFLAFATKPLRELCERQPDAEREYGVAIARALRNRIADLRVATSIADMVAGSPAEQVDDPTRMTVTLTARSRLVLCSNHNQTPIRDSGAVDWSRVSRIKILDIEVDDD